MAGKKHEDFEKQLARLRDIVAVLEQGETPLEQGLALYKEGATLVAACRERLAAARNEVEILNQGVFQAFETEEEDA